MTGIRVVKGDPSAEELAALVLVLLSVARTEDEPAAGRRAATWRPPEWTPPTWKG